MSRSYKHTPRCGDTKSRYAKRLANHAVRQYRQGFPQYGGYRKVFERWNICDYETVGETFEQFYANRVKRNLFQPLPNRTEARNQYERWYLRK